MFSIITTTYKHEKYIAETIESILSQSFDDWQLLIGDDSPDDATWDIIQTYTEKYPEKIRAWHHTQNKGIVENMNFLIRHIAPRAEYVAFLEGDDRFIPSCLHEKLAIFTEYPEVWLVYSDMDFIDEKNHGTFSRVLGSGSVHFYKNERIDPRSYILARNPLIVSYSSVAVRRSVLTRYLPIENLTGSKTYSVSDYDLFFRITSNERVFGIEKSLTEYRRHSNNLSRGYHALFDDLWKLIDAYYQKREIERKIYEKKRSWISILLAVSALAEGDKKRSWKYLKESFSFSWSSDSVYKIALAILLLLPTSLSATLIQRRLRRGN